MAVAGVASELRSLAYRGAFAIGAAGFLASALAGIAFELASRNRLPPPRIEPLALAERALAEGDLERAADEYTTLAAIEVRQAEGLLQLGRIRERQGDLRGATRAWDAALARPPTPPRLHARLAWLHARLGETEEARRHARAALRRGIPLAPALLQQLGLEPRPARK